MHPNIRQCHETLWSRFFHPDTNLFYESRFEKDADFPTVAELSTMVPGSNCGRGRGMGDTCLLTGFIAESVLWAYRVTRRPEYAEKARKLFKGLTLLGTASKVPGFIPRGVAPGRTDHYPNSSVDQYTTWFAGVWRYATGTIAFLELAYWPGVVAQVFPSE